MFWSFLLISPQLKYWTLKKRFLNRLTTSMLKLEGETLMKKSLIALAVASAMTVPMVAQADATIFGEYVGYISDSDNGDLSIENDTIDIGVMGTVENGIDGLETGYKFLFNAEGDDGVTGTENAYAYMAGDWGTFTLGKQDNLADITEDVGEQGGEFAAGGDEHTAASYMTPEMGGFFAGVSIAADGDDTTDSVTEADVVLGFAADNFSVALGFEDYEDSTLTTFTGTYSMDAFGAFLNIQDGDDVTEDYWSIGGTFAATDAVEVYAEYGVQDLDGGDGKQTLIGASYGMGDAYVALEYNSLNEEAGDNDTILFAYGLEF